jgi:hypothetical protein
MVAISLRDLALGRTTTYATPFTHPVGTRLELRHAGCTTHKALIWAYTPDKYCYGGVQAKIIVQNAEGNYRMDNLCGNIIHKYHERAGIGFYEGRGDCLICGGIGSTFTTMKHECLKCNGTGGRLQIADKEELEAALENATKTQNAENEKRRIAMAEAERIQEAGRNLLHLLGDSPAIIVAELIKDESDLSTDYFGHTKTKTVILALSKSKRVSFSEMRKAVLNSSDPEIRELATSYEEHRENYSMGAGTYMTAKGNGSHSSGWRIRKTTKWSDHWDNDIVKALGTGAHCLKA